MKKLVIILISLFASNVNAEGWCNYSPGQFEIITNGNKTDLVYINGRFNDTTTSKWLVIANSSVGKHNISIALAAQMAGKGLGIYVDSPEYSCETFPSWGASPIRHIRIIM
ncbi:MAG: hypothetical protein OQJ89_04425 [Kangiellaceae bacterium]|nr:hypothetical protein [Kangiellaceae bacterium]MCW8997242.1 hypothetical protein [Kangiellaceae bacterium]MCW9016188.1 hypothetical protein [Kangiellaceae bacterium]